MSCELGRYDTLAFGTETFNLGPTVENPAPIQGRATFIVRFNPHDTPTMTVEFIDRVRVFIQILRNLMTCPLSIDDRIGAIVYYLFYGKGNVHQDAAKHASMTIRVMPYINDPADVPLDDDIAAFSLKDLEDRDIDAAIQDNLVQKAASLASGKGQCHAINNAPNPKMKNRCSGHAKKGSLLCDRHFKRWEAGYVVVEVDQ